MRLAIKESDKIGAFASTLCMIHCFATPFIFVAQSCALSCCSVAPDWWRWIDYFFLTIAFFAVYNSTKTTSKKLMKPALWISWIALFTLIMNEAFQLYRLSVTYKYVAGTLLAVLHLYNLKFCQCKNDKCCTKINK